MNRKILIFALLCSIVLLSALPAVSAKKTTKNSTTATNTTQSQDDQQDGGLVLLPDILNRLEGESSDDTDLGPELPENSETSDDSSAESSDDGPSIMDMEDDSDGVANIYNEEHGKSLLNEGVPENQEKSLLNEDEGASNTNSTPNNLLEQSDDEIAMTAVDVDGEFHSFEVQPCTIVEIPINKHSVQIRVTGFFNADLVMITDGQFTNCAQLASFECPQDALFCRKESLDAEDDEAILLDQEACGIENAYLYVLPAPNATAVSYAVKVQSIGEPQCEEDSEPLVDENAQEQQEQTVVPPQEESEDEEEEQNDDSEDATDATNNSDEESETEEDSENATDNGDEESETEEQDSDDATDTDDEDSEDSDEEINDDQILEATAEIDGKFHAFDVEVCTVLSIPINQQSVNVNVDGVFNTDKIMLTDTKLASCDKLNQFRCPANNTFCQIQSLEEGGDIQVCSQAAGIDTLYLYILPETFEGMISYQINTTFIDQTQCNNQDAGAAVVTGGDSDTTDASDASDASDDSTDAASTSGDENNDSQTAAPADGDTGVEATADTQSIGDSPSKVNGWGIFGIIFGVSLAIFMAVVCVYRRQFKRNRVEMFHPPAWCPMCLFPRASEGLISQDTRSERFEFNEYEPPVL